MHIQYAAIDPLALIFPTSVYLKIVEKLHPNEPPIAHIAEVAKTMTAEEKTYVQARLRTLGAYTDAVSKAVGQTAAAKG